jgi:hypothetical protein
MQYVESNSRSLQICGVLSCTRENSSPWMYNHPCDVAKIIETTLVLGDGLRYLNSKDTGSPVSRGTERDSTSIVEVAEGD